MSYSVLQCCLVTGRGYMSAQPLACCVTVGNLLNFSVPQCSHQSNGDSNNVIVKLI